MLSSSLDGVGAEAAHERTDGRDVGVHAPAGVDAPVASVVLVGERARLGLALRARRVGRTVALAIGQVKSAAVQTEEVALAQVVGRAVDAAFRAGRA